MFSWNVSLNKAIVFLFQLIVHLYRRVIFYANEIDLLVGDHDFTNRKRTIQQRIANQLKLMNLNENILWIFQHLKRLTLEDMKYHR